MDIIIYIQFALYSSNLINTKNICLFLQKMSGNSNDLGNCELFLFKNVSNSQQLHSAIMQGKMQCAMVKPSLIAHPLQIAVSAKKSLAAKQMSNDHTTNSKCKGLMTKSVFTEILYNLAPTKNIAESLKVYGLGIDDKEILVVFIKDSTSKSDYKLLKEEVLQQINGEQISDLMNEEHGLPSFTNWDLISKVHKLKSIPTRQNIIDLLVSRSATKDVS